MSDLFDQEDNSQQEDNSSYYDKLVGEGKKFRDNESLARGKFESDNFIENLQRENMELRTELNSRLNMEALVNKIGRGNNSTPPLTGDGLEHGIAPTPIVTPTKAEVDPNEIASIVKNTMTQEHTRLQQENNLKVVAKELKKTWGDNWVDKLRKVGMSLDMSEAQMDLLAKTSPKVLLASVMKHVEKVDNETFTPPRSSVTGLSKPVDENSGWGYYEKLRKSNPKEYFSTRVQNQLHKDVMSGKVVLPSE